MVHTLDLRIFELLTARLCHDLVGPVGAAGNGAELLRELGAEEAGDAVELIAESASKAADRLRFYRVAYGLAGGSIGTIEEGSAPDATFDLALANISGLVLERLAPALSGVLSPGGRLIASGFLEDAADGLQRAFEANRLRVERVVEDGIWRAIIARRDS